MSKQAAEARRDELNARHGAGTHYVELIGNGVWRVKRCPWFCGRAALPAGLR